MEKKVNKIDPFNPVTGVLTIGDYKGKSFDEVFEIDPGYILRMVMYHGLKWKPELRQSFDYWTRIITENYTGVSIESQYEKIQEYNKNKLS